MKIIEVGSELFHQNLDRLEEDYRAFLYPRFIANKYFLAYDGDAVGGFTVNRSGLLEGLFTLKRGIGAELFEKQIELTLQMTRAKELTLFCATDFLKDYYIDKGFKIDVITKFDDDLAADGWNYERFGKPNFYDMSRGV